MWPHLHPTNNNQSLHLEFWINTQLVSINHVTLLITVALQANNSASKSVYLSELHVATCAALDLVCLHRATLPGNTLCYVTNDELELTVEQNQSV